MGDLLALRMTATAYVIDLVYEKTGRNDIVSSVSAALDAAGATWAAPNSINPMRWRQLSANSWSK